MDHELRHFREYERFLEELSAQLKTELTGLFANRVQHYKSRDAGDKAINDTISGYLQPRMERAQAEIAARQAKHDTPEEYFRLDRFREACAPR
jgi:hypothetical protein